MVGLSWALVAILIVSWLFGSLIVGYNAPWFYGLLVVALVLAFFNVVIAPRNLA